MLELECLGKLADYYEKSVCCVVRWSLVCSRLMMNFSLSRLLHTCIILGKAESTGILQCETWIINTNGHGWTRPSGIAVAQLLSQETWASAPCLLDYLWKRDLCSLATDAKCGVMSDVDTDVGKIFSCWNVSDDCWQDKVERKTSLWQLMYIY